MRCAPHGTTSTDWSADVNRLSRATADELAPLLTIIEPAYPEVLARIAECLYLVLRDTLPGTPSEHARLALAQAELVRAELGGSQFYLAKGQGYDLSVRDREILARFNGRNHRQLAHDHGVTERYIYDIVARRGREEFERRQGRLPGLDPEDAAA